MNLAAPLVVAAHVERLPGLPGWDGVAVSDGPATARDDATRVCTIGYVTGSADATLTLAPAGDAQNRNHEDGAVVCGLVVAGDGVADTRTAILGLLAEWAGWLARDRVLAEPGGVARLLPNSGLALAAEVAFVQTRAGVTATAVVTITYSAVTYG